MISEKLTSLRKLMKENALDAYIIPTGDDHMSEYLCAHFKEREYLSGFTGSAGTLLVTEDSAALWADGRYHIQAENQTVGTGIHVFKEGLKDVPNIKERIEDIFAGRSGRVGVCGRFISAGWGEAMKKVLAESDIELVATEDIVDKIWKDRPALPKSETWFLGDELVGENAVKKLARFRKTLAQNESCVIGTLDEVAWLLNIRGRDIEHSLTKLAFLIVSKRRCILYLNGMEDINDELRGYFKQIGVTVKRYADFYKDIKKLKGHIIFDKKKMNYLAYELLSDNKNCTIKNERSMITEFKAVKNPVEMKNLAEAHIIDGVAMVRFIKWIRENAGHVTELEASDHLEKIRRRDENCLGLSFDTICAYGAHGAIVHYSATPETNVLIKKKGLLLVDSGGQYNFGTTDVTRTIAVGPVTKEMKKCYTAVLKGTLRLAALTFPSGSDGVILDSIAREPIWEIGCDYLHGTGHGIGYMLNVHEGPVSISNRGSRIKEFEFAEGMVTSDEPGIYINDKFGIRIENQLVCMKRCAGMYTDMLGFDTLTCIPVEGRCIDRSMMSDHDIRLLNDYQQWVYDMLKDRLNEEERTWLYNETRPI